MKYSIWFYLHLAVIFSGIFLVHGGLGWVLATFSAACAWLICKFPYPAEPHFAEYTPGTVSPSQETGAGMFQDMDESVTDPGYVGIKYFGD